MVKNIMTLLKAWLIAYATLLVFFLCMDLNNAQSQNPEMTNCDANDDPFIKSNWYNDKVFLHPWATNDKKGDWYFNRAYCAKNCAEMVTIHSAAENQFFHDFLISVGMRHPGAWLGAQIQNRQDASKWYNGMDMNFCPKARGEFNERGLTCLDIGWNAARVWWRNYYCTGAVAQRHMIVCQKHKIQNETDNGGDYGTTIATLE